jgi:hypothetical protein
MRKGRAVSSWERFLAARKASLGVRRLKSTLGEDRPASFPDYRRFWDQSLDQLAAYLRQVKRK